MKRLVVLVAVSAAVGILLSGAAASSAPAKASCNASNPILVGALYSMTGPGAGLGKLAQQGASLAISDVNSRGGWLGRCVKDVLGDDATSPTTAAQEIRKLVVEDHVEFVIGPFESSTTAVALPQTTQAKMIEIIGSSALDFGDASKWPYVFRNEVNTNQIAETFVPFLKAKHWTHVAAWTFNSAFGTSLAASLQSLLAPEGITITKTVVVNSGTPDVTPQMQEVKSTGPQAILAGVSADVDEVALIKARNALGWNVPILGLNSMSSPVTTGTFNKTEMQNVYSGQVYKTLTYASTESGSGRPTWPAAAKFISEFAKWIHAYNIKESITQAAGSYDSVMILGNAITKAKSLDSSSVKSYLETHPTPACAGPTHGARPATTDRRSRTSSSPSRSRSTTTGSFSASRASSAGERRGADYPTASGLYRAWAPRPVSRKPWPTAPPLSKRQPCS